MSTMDSGIAWSDLLEIYKNSKWLEGEEAEVSLASERMKAVFRLVESDDDAQRVANVSALVDLEGLQVGSTFKARIGAPRLALGLLTENWDTFLSSPDARTKEPSNYFIKEDGTFSGGEHASKNINSYRAALGLVDLLGKAALFLDAGGQKLVYYRDQKIEVPIRFSASDLDDIDIAGINSLRDVMDGELHGDQKFAIFTDAIVTLAESQPPERRLVYLSQNIEALSKRVIDGYRLFASNFSYAKIRGQVEAAQSEYITKIHKTFVDIQGQILGIPIAAVVVASQLKKVDECGINAWANVAIISGAWVFVLLLFLSCVNQWLTLNAINNDVERQLGKLKREYADISNQFQSVFTQLQTRICWHRIGLTIVVLIAIAGAVFASIAFAALTNVNTLSECRGERVIPEQQSMFAGRDLHPSIR